MATNKTDNTNKLPVNPDSALNPAWDVNEEKPDKTDFAVVPPSKYDISVPAGPAKSKKAEKAPKENAPKEKADKPSKVKEPKQGGSKKILVAAIAVILVAAIAACTVLFIVPLAKYSKANKLFAQGKYEEAIAAYTALGDYKDAPEKIEEVKLHIIDERYASAADLYDNSKFEEAKAIFEDIGDYKDAPAYVSNCNYQLGVKAMSSKDYETALALFNESDLEEAAEHAKECKYQICLADTTNSDEIYAMFKELADANYKDSAKQLKEHFKWVFTSQINNTENDSKNHLAAVTKTEKIYFHFQISGGIPDDVVKFKVSYRINDGKEAFFKFDEEYKAGDKLWASVELANPDTDTGDIIFTIYDMEDNVLATNKSTLK